MPGGPKQAIGMAAVSGWLHVTWLGPEFPKKAGAKYDVQRLGLRWFPDIRVLNSLSDGSPLLSDDTEVRVGPKGDVNAVVRLQCRVPVWYDIPFGSGTYTMQIRLGSLLIPAEDVVFEALKNAVDMSDYSGGFVNSLVIAGRFDSKDFTSDGIYSSITATLKTD